MSRTNEHPDTPSSTRLMTRMYQSPFWLLVLVACAVLLTNIVEIFFYWIYPSSSEQKLLIEIFIDFIFVFPILYFFFFRPMVFHIAERQRVLDSLRESEERFRSFFHSSLDGLLVATLDGTVLEANSEACRILGITKHRVNGSGLVKISPVEQLDLSCFLDERSSAAKARGELTCRRGDGTPFPCEVSSAQFNDRHGRSIASLTLRDITDRKQAESELRASREQLRSLSGHLLKVREEERWTIGREIHDELGQILATVQLKLSLITNRYPHTPQLAGELAEAEQLTIEAIKSVRRIATQLRPAILEVLGLAEAIEWLVGEFQNRTGTACACDILLPEREYPRDVAMAAFRICQEAITNVMRHADATQVVVSLDEKFSRIVLTIRDNGKGITRSQMRGSRSLGIFGMKERAFLLGGRVRIIGAPGKGTVVIAHIPMAPHQETADARNQESNHR